MDLPVGNAIEEKKKIANERAIFHLSNYVFIIISVTTRNKKKVEESVRNIFVVQELLRATLGFPYFLCTPQ